MLVANNNNKKETLAYAADPGTQVDVVACSAEYLRPLSVFPPLNTSRNRNTQCSSWHLCLSDSIYSRMCKLLSMLRYEKYGNPSFCPVHKCSAGIPATVAKIQCAVKSHCDDDSPCDESI